ncbi:hypothetical protein [Streptomyces griseorubiginosus]|uniref:hypothetical protein n=1 Tax=Streptomyces griseorubiginosus TaxID=67304 RepID=UPI003328CFB7
MSSAQGRLERSPRGERDGCRLNAAGTAAVRVRDIPVPLDSGLTLDDARASLPCLDGDLTAGRPPRQPSGSPPSAPPS